MGAASATDERAVIKTAIKSVSQIATLPEITLKIIELVEDPDSTAQDLHTVISNDPALCSRILKVVNSAFYGLPRQIGSINRAIVLLGLNAVKNIAIAASLTKLFRGGDMCSNFSARDLWVHSIGTAACSKLIVDELGMNFPDEAFLAGLLHDIGLMVEMQSMRKPFIEMFDSITFDEDGAPDREFLELERDVLGADHQAFGAALCESWKFPKSFAYVAGHHHDPMALPPESRRLSCIVHIADRLSATLEGGFRGDLMCLDVDPAVLETIGMTMEQLERVKHGLPGALEEVKATFA